MMIIMSVQHHQHHHQRKSGAFSRESKAKMHRTLATIGDASRPRLAASKLAGLRGDRR